MVSICVFLITSKWVSFHMPVGHLYVFFEKCFFRSSTHFSVGLFDFLYLVSWGAYIFFMLTLYQSINLHIFSAIQYFFFFYFVHGSLHGASGKEPTCQFRRHKRCKFHPWVRKIPWRRKWQPTPVFLPGKPHGQKRLVGYSTRGHKELETTEHKHMIPSSF